MPFVLQNLFRVIGPKDDPTASSQYAPYHSIGGSATTDGQDESTATLQNASWAYVQACREVLSQYFPRSQAAFAPNWIMSTTSAVPVDVCVLTFDLSEAREGVKILLDVGIVPATVAPNGATVVVDIRRRDTAALLGSGVHLATTVRENGFVAIAGLTQTACYAEISLGVIGGVGTATLYGVHIYSDEATP